MAEVKTPRSRSTDKKLSSELDAIINKDEYKGILREIPFPNMIYIPLLRGLRTLNKTENIYKNRTLIDYFQSTSTNNDTPININTGHDLYDLFYKKLLGMPDDRNAIRDYESIIGEYFFENQKVTIIPEYNKDILSIKIGNDDQYPIHNLGDGLQSVLILTAYAFLDATPSLFFIEEPENNLHPGLLKNVIQFLEEQTPHQYFMTTHSNHIIDRIDTTNNTLLYKISRNNTDQKKLFTINNLDKIHEFMYEMGVFASSVYMANCTIWIEGITDRLYIETYLKKYMQQEKHKFTNNIHYSFMEYQGSVLGHWDFSKENTAGVLSAYKSCPSMILIADGDITNKKDRMERIKSSLKERFIVLNSKEIENTIPEYILKKTVASIIEKRQSEPPANYKEIIENIKYKDYNKKKIGLGKYLDALFGIPGYLGEKSGTIKDKVKFCKITIEHMERDDTWVLHQNIHEICKLIYSHIKKYNNFSS